MWKAGGPSVPSPHWVAGLALTSRLHSHAATGGAREGIFHAAVSISQRSLAPQDRAGGKLAWAEGG